MENDITKMFRKLNGLMQVREEIKKGMLANPQQRLSELGIEITKINLVALQKEAAELETIKGEFEKVFPTEQFGNLVKLTEKLRKQEALSTEDLTRLSAVSLSKIPAHISEMGKDCFWSDRTECSEEIIRSHSIQRRNSKLEFLAKNSKKPQHVYEFKRYELLSKSRKVMLVPIRIAGTFFGFCKKHDGEIFKPIDNNPFNGLSEHCFLHSYRSFAYTYHRIKEFHSYITVLSNRNIEIAKKYFHIMAGVFNALGMKSSLPIPTFNGKGVTPEILREYEAQRFEKYRTFLNNYYKSRHYGELDYIVHEVPYLSPIVASSRAILHIEAENSYILPDDGVYRGFPCMITIFPENGSTYIILSRFKFDLHGELMFTALRKLTREALEVEVSKMIFEQLENFYIAPAFWDSLSEEERAKLLHDINTPKQGFPDGSSFTPNVNIFDKKYSLTGDLIS